MKDQKSKKSLKEAIDNNYTVEDLKKLNDIDEKSDFEIGTIVQPKDNDNTAWCWDSSYEIDGNKVTIHGYVAPGGPEAGKVTIETDFDHFKRMYELRGDISSLDSLDLTDEEKDLVRSIVNQY